MHQTCQRDSGKCTGTLDTRPPRPIDGRWNRSAVPLVFTTEDQRALRRLAMDLNSTFFTRTILLGSGLFLLVVIACAEEYVPPPPMPPAPAATSAPAPTSPPLPLPPPTPTLEERRVQTPTDFRYNTRVVDGDIHVWHAPHCPPVPPATFVASVILTDLRSGSHLNRDGSVRSSPGPDYRTDEGRERFAEVLRDSSLMELILVPFECP